MSIRSSSTVSIADLAHSQTIEREEEADGFGTPVGLATSRPVVC
jgi:hypothetical protein